MDIFGDYPGSRVKRLRVEDDAYIGGDLTVEGKINGGGPLDPSHVYVDDGTETAPTISFADEKNTGFYKSAPGQVSFTGRGTKRLRLGETDSQFYQPLIATSVTATTVNPTVLNVGGTSSFTGTINCTDIVASSSVTAPTFVSNGTNPLLLTSSAPTVAIATIDADLQILSHAQEIVNFSSIAATFTGTVTAPIIGATSAALATLNCTSGTINTATCPTLNCTTGTVTTLSTGTVTNSGTVNSVDFKGSGTTPIVLTSAAYPVIATTSSPLVISPQLSPTVTFFPTHTDFFPPITCNGITAGTMSASTMSLSGQSYLELTKTSQTIPSGVDTLVTYNAVFRQQGINLALDVADDGTITITSPTNGLYAVTATVGWDADATGTRELMIRRNGSYNIAWEAVSATANMVQTTGCTTYALMTGSTFQVRVYQTSGNPRTLTNIRVYVARIW